MMSKLLTERLVLRTERLVLRPWREQDAASLYGCARDPQVGPIAGWPVHTSVENSRQVIREILSAPETYAITLRDIDEAEPDEEAGPGPDEAVGSIGLMIGLGSNLLLPGDEGEIGYWIGRRFWGRGLVTEAAREVIRHAFNDLNLNTLWCGWFEGNDRSRRVGEKCGFRLVRSEQRYWPAIERTVTQHISRLTKDEWQKRL